ncbi:hypothetical protein ACSBR2_026521 [Camellia fascicularis]
MQALTTQFCQGPCQDATQRTFHPLRMSLSRALQVLEDKGYLKCLDLEHLLDLLSAGYDPTLYCVFHQQTGHETDQCSHLRHKIQDLIDNQIITPLKPSITTNHDKATPSSSINFIQTTPTFDPSQYVILANLPKPLVHVPEEMGINILREGLQEDNPDFIAVFETRIEGLIAELK